MIRLFGPLAIEDGERSLGPRDLGGARPKQVLQILLAARGHRVPTDQLAELIWEGDRPRNAAGSLQTFISMLRRHLTSDRERARELVVTEVEAYRFATDLVTLDLDRFDTLLERSAHEPTNAARASLEEALALVRGDVLEDEPYATWALDLRNTYEVGSSAPTSTPPMRHLPSWTSPLHSPTPRRQPVSTPSASADIAPRCSPCMRSAARRRPRPISHIPDAAR